MHKLPELPYGFDALEPYIDAQTMETHYTKHHQTYIDKLNAALEKYPALQEKTLSELLTDLNSIPEDVRTAIRNHGGGHLNHSIFWTLLSAAGGGEPTDSLAEAINNAFESFNNFQEKFENSAASLFGSGWTWLVLNNGQLEITNTPNQDNPIMNGQRAVLGVDMWEHAYYLKHQNKKADYLKDFWQILNWEEANNRFENL